MLEQRQPVLLRGNNFIYPAASDDSLQCGGSRIMTLTYPNRIATSSFQTPPANIFATFEICTFINETLSFSITQNSSLFTSCFTNTTCSQTCLGNSQGSGSLRVYSSFGSYPNVLSIAPSSNYDLNVAFVGHSMMTFNVTVNMKCSSGPTTTLAPGSVFVV